MALPEIRFSWRVQLSDTGRGVDASTTLHALLHPSESLERLYLRLLAWAVWYSPELRFGPGLSTPDAPALFADDPTGRKTTWIMLNPASAEKVHQAVRHNHGALVGVIFDGKGSWDRFLEGTRTFKGLEQVEFVRVEEEFLTSMAEQLQERRYDVALTIVEDTLYLSAGGRDFVGTFERFRGIPQTAIQAST